MTKSILFSLLALPFLICNSLASKAQSVVYYSADMGAIGYAYSNDETSNDIKTLEESAHKDCMDHGGRSCTLLYETPKVGWAGVLRGRDVNGNPLVITVGHQQSQAFARGELKRKYLDKDGIEYNDVLVITWLAE